MRIPLCLLLLFLLAGAADAKTENWQQLKQQSEQLRNSDPIYALFKLQQAWDLLAKKSPESASKELRHDLALTYGKLNPQAELNCSKLTEGQLQAHMKNSRNLDQWQTWKISKKNGALYLSAPESILDERSGCLSGMISAEEEAKKDPQKRKELDEYYARENAKVKEKVALLPVVISTTNEKYQDLLALSGPLKDGENKAVTFDINAFVPKQFTRINWP
jgi:hypothetical protein